ncbi:hypothetical protein [Tenacibaculum halocynthiae]|uniref:hypothetical protein n=1 Tax=Tenacibaculum halocynthiae TaxID=1254437 RepID=UPI003895FA98
MKTATIKVLKDELEHQNSKELLELCLKLIRFKKENKELLTYLLFEAHNEEQYRETVKKEIDVLFSEVNTKSYFYIRKSVRKILTTTKKYIRYSKNKETEIELLLYFCLQLKNVKPSIKKSPRIQNVLITQVRLIRKGIDKLHEDLQFDYNEKLIELDL